MTLLVKMRDHYRSSKFPQQHGCKVGRDRLLGGKRAERSHQGIFTARDGVSAEFSRVGVAALRSKQRLAVVYVLLIFSLLAKQLPEGAAQLDSTSMLLELRDAGLADKLRLPTMLGTKPSRKLRLGSMGPMMSPNKKEAGRLSQEEGKLIARACCLSLHMSPTMSRTLASGVILASARTCTRMEDSRSRAWLMSRRVR